MIEIKSTQLADGLVFGEGPRWRDRMLWFSDIYGGRVMTVDERGRKEVVAEVPQRPSGLGWLPDGRLLIASMGDRLLLRLDPDGLKTHADLSHLARGINDMVVDGQGRAYVDGTDDVMQPGKIILVTPDGRSRVAAEGFEAPNGCVITPDGKTFVLAEVRGRRLTAFDILPDGSLANRRVWADFSKTTRSVPDGICLDAEGCIWIGSFTKGEFLRVRPGGEITHRVATPGRWSVAPMLGGRDRRTLFMMTAITTMQDLPQGKSVGFVETARVDVPGAGWP